MREGGGQPPRTTRAWRRRRRRAAHASLRFLIDSSLALCVWNLGSTASSPKVQYLYSAVAAPPLSTSTTIGLPASAVDSTVASVPGPPCTTSCTIGMLRPFETAASSAERSSISEPHAAPPVLPLSTKTKCVWCGLSGAPSRVGGDGVYDATAVGPCEEVAVSCSRPLTTPQGKTPTTGRLTLYRCIASPTRRILHGTTSEERAGESAAAARA